MCLMLQVMTYLLSRISSETHLAAYGRFSRTVLNIISQKETQPVQESHTEKWLVGNGKQQCSKGNKPPS